MTWWMRCALTVGVIVWLLLLILIPLSAQTHPCDGTQPTTYQIRRNDAGRFGWCHSQQDDDGGSIPFGSIRFRVIDAQTNAVLVDLGTPQPMTNTAGAAGYYFESQQSVSFSSDRVINISAEYNGFTVLGSTPITIDTRGGPRAPSGLRIVLQ